MTKTMRLWMAGALVAGLVTPALVAEPVRLGKKPGQTKGRWLEVQDPAKLAAHDRVAIGDVSSDIQWKKDGKESPIDENMLNDKIRQYLLENLRKSSLFTEVLESVPSNEKGLVRLDVHVLVDPGNRAARYLVGAGAGKSKSVIDIKMTGTGGADLGKYHGYGVGSGMGFKIGGGGARKMTEDDVQENAKKFVQLLQEVRG